MSEKGRRGDPSRFWERLKPTFLIASITKSSLLHQSQVPESLGCKIEIEWRRKGLVSILK